MQSKKYTLILLAILIIYPVICTAADTPSTEKIFGSVEERRLENTIVQERANLRKEREEIALRKKDLKTLEEGVDKKIARIDIKLEELKALQRKIETLLTEKSAVDKKKTQNLALIYAKMSPAKAALAMSGLDEKLAADLLASMKVKSAAKILDQLSKQKASILSTTFSTLQIE